MDLLFSPLLSVFTEPQITSLGLNMTSRLWQKRNLGYHTVPFDTHQSLFNLVLWSQNCKWLF